MLNISDNRVNEDVIVEEYFAWEHITDPKPAKSLVIWIGIFIMIGLIILALPWTQNIQATGSVTTLYPGQRPQEVESTLAGRIEKWYVNEGDTVQAGDTILHLSEIKDDYFDPQLLDRTQQQIDAKSQAGVSYSQKAIALREQKKALAEAMKLKTLAAENYLRQAYFKQRADSMDVVLARVSDSIANLQLKRWEALFAQDLKSRTDLEKMKKERQEALTKLIAQENKWAASRAGLLNARIELNNVQNEYGEKLQKAESERQGSLSSFYDTQAQVSKMENQLSNYAQRSQFRYILAPQTGIIDVALKAGIGETIKEGEPVISIVPLKINMAAEIYVRAVDMPLIRKGQPVRLEFDGWPAIIFGTGWPTAAFGTFGGKVYAIENAMRESSSKGTYRILIEMEKPEEDPWPTALRLGSGVKAFALLKRVPVWYEIWRQLNGFPLSFTKGLPNPPKLKPKQRTVDLETNKLINSIAMRSHRLARKLSTWILLGFLGGSLSLQAQYLPPDIQELDSLYQLRLEDYLDGVIRFHPVAQQSELLAQQAQAVLRTSRGGFDPKLYGDYDDKYFKGSNYWRLLDGGLSMQTRLGVELKGGFVYQDGDFLNSERSIPTDGQLVVGAKVPLGQGLIIDQRRAALKQAQIFQQANDIEQWLQLNDLLFEATLAYWDWSLASAQQELFAQAFVAAQERFEALKNTFIAGDAAGIDTVEAFTQVQQFAILFREASLATEMNRLTAETFLWNPIGEPFTLPDSVGPVPIMESSLSENTLFSDMEAVLVNLENHPELQKIQYKLADLEIERRFKADKLKPKLDLSYNLLSNSLGGESLSSTYSLSPENYKWGVNFSFPLFLRKERGALAQTKIKIQDTQLYRDNKRLELQNKILAYAEQTEVLQNQVERIAIQVYNYQLLYNGEIQKFDAGESTLFLINSRQQKLIEAQQKQLELEFKWRKAQTYLDWVNGTLYTPQ